MTYRTGSLLAALVLAAGCGEHPTTRRHQAQDTIGAQPPAPMFYDGYKWRQESGPSGINTDIPMIIPEWHDWHGDMACAFIDHDQTVSEMRVGQCAFLWIVFRDSNGEYLAFLPERVHPTQNKLFRDHLIQMRDDWLHVWLQPNETITTAEKPLWRGVYKPVRAHTHSKIGSYYSE